MKLFKNLLVNKSKSYYKQGLNKMIYSNNNINNLLYSCNNHNNINNKYFSTLIGLNMGGTNTCIAIHESAGPRVIENSDGLRMTPTVVGVSLLEEVEKNNVNTTKENLEKNKEKNEEKSSTQNFEYRVSLNAKKIMITNKHSSFYGNKYFFNPNFNKNLIKQFIQNKRFGFNFEHDIEENKINLIDLDSNTVHTPSVITSKHLAYVKEQADEIIGKSINKVIMSIPSYMENEQTKLELTESMKSVGLVPYKFINEANASLLAYNISNKKNILVFNFGGLDFSLSLLTRNEGEGENSDKQDTEKKEKKAASATTEENNDEDNIDTVSPMSIINSYSITKEFNDFFLGGIDIDNLSNSRILK